MLFRPSRLCRFLLGLLALSGASFGAKTIFVFNPWDGTYPLERPVMFVDGATTGTAMTGSVEWCGWYVQKDTGAPRTLHVQSSGRQTPYGATGLGSATDIDISFLHSDTVWIDTRTATPTVLASNPGGSGTCPGLVLATTVRDFASNHPNFGRTATGTIRGMVKDSTGMDGKPVKRLDTAWNTQFRSWFRDSSAVNAATCRDFWLTLDTTTGDYRHFDTAYFPIDTFSTLATGSANPFNERVAFPTNKHNHSFCTESHGEFQYHYGQKMTFGGNDDRWLFLNRKLRVDLGGLHSDTTVSILLDTMGLVDSAYYPWDFFACQRTNSFSHLLLSGAVKLSSEHRFRIADSLSPSGVRFVRAFSLRSQGLGCQATEIKLPVPSEAFLEGPATPWSRLATGIRYGGIEVDSVSMQVRIDTSKLKGLPPGAYRLRLRIASDTLVYKDFAFTSPNPPFLVSAGSRCDLMSRALPDSGGCIDIGKLDGTTIQVPLATTRLSSDGLVLCGSTSTSNFGTDIVYLIDQSGSMSGSDPTSARARIVQDAVRIQSTLNPESYAGWISFESNFTASSLYNLADSVQKNALLQDIQVVNGGGTNYSGPLGWARAMLQGATDGIQNLSPSPSRRKAIIMISDGDPADLAASLAALAPQASVQDVSNHFWTLPNDSTVPVYGFLIASNITSTTGSALRTITQQSHGDFIPIPVGDPDSLRKAMTRILGAIVHPSVPDTLDVLNQANGQKSTGLLFKKEGSGWRFHLDSLVGLEQGRNEIALRNVLTTDHGDSSVVSHWTVVVSDSGLNLGQNGDDSTIDAACFEPTKLKLRPATDSLRLFADARDTSLRAFLDLRFDRQMAYSVAFSTKGSGDSGWKSLVLPVAPLGIRALLNGTFPWTLPPVSKTDTTVQTHYGWDTVRAVFRTPRDRRDSAVAYLPVYHPWPAGISLSPDTADGAVGSLRVTVSDSGILTDTVSALISHRGGDSLWVLLHRESTGRFSGVAPYRQNHVVVRGDNLLQTGPLRAVPLDSVFASYRMGHDTAILRHSPLLRWIDSAGRPVDTLALSRLDPGETDSLRLGLFFDTLLFASSDSVEISASPWLEVQNLSGTSLSGIRLLGGTAQVLVHGLRPALGGQVVLRRWGKLDSLVRTLDVLPYHLRYLDGTGKLVDSAFVDRDLFSDTLMRVEVWGQQARCQSCNGWVRVSSSASQIHTRDSASSSIDSFPILSGRGELVLHGTAPVLGASLSLHSSSPWAPSQIAPITFRSYRIRFVDPSGNAVDSARVDRDLFSDTLLQVEIWGRNGLCTTCNGTLGVSTTADGIVWRDSAGNRVDSFSLTQGRGSIRISGTKPVADSLLRIGAPLFGAMAQVPLTFRPYRIRFVDPSGNAVDSARVDRDLFSDTLLQVEIWGRNGLCTSCNGAFGTSTSTVGVVTRDSAGNTVDSFSLTQGRGSLRISGTKPVADSLLHFGVPLFGATSQIPLTFRPYRMRFVEPGGNVVDSARIDRDLFSDTLLQVEIWGRNGLCTSCNGSFRGSTNAPQISWVDSSGSRVDSLVLTGGRGSLRLHNTAPVANVRLDLVASAFGASASITPITFEAYRLRRVTPSGVVSDSFAFDSLLRQKVALTVEVWGLHGPLRTSGHLRVGSNSSSLVFLDSLGNPDSVFVLVDGRASLRVRSDIPQDSSILTLSVDSLMAHVTWGPLAWHSPPPDSASYFDRDGDGGLDLVRVWFPLPWNPQNRLRLPWPDSTHFLDLTSAQINVASDSLSVEWSFATSPSPKTTTWSALPVSARFWWNANQRALGFPIHERIPPIPLRAQLRRGASSDSLIVWVSESLDSLGMSQDAKLVTRVWPASNEILSKAPSWESNTRRIRLPIGRDSIDRLVRPGDSIRLTATGDARDLGQNAPGLKALAVEVEGSERAPIRAIVSDANADGRADRVTLYFQYPPHTIDNCTFAWPNSSGSLQTRHLVASKAVADSGGRILSFDLAPWEFGVTSCPDSVCKQVGRLQTTRWADTFETRFDLVDGVDPIILKAQLRFGKAPGTLDTIYATLSEPVQSTPGAPWLRWGRPSRDSLGQSIDEKAAPIRDGNRLELFVDSTFLGSAKDSVRLAARGGIGDKSGNVPGRFAHWTLLELGPMPLHIQITPWPAKVTYGHWEVPATEPALNLFTRSHSTDPWKSLGGVEPSQILSHYAGVLINANSDLDGGVLYLYDNMGTAVASIDLLPLFQTMHEAGRNGELRSGFQAWVAWNGKTSSGSMASSGVYLGRIFAWKGVGAERSVINQTYRLGWQVNQAPSWDEYGMPNW